MKEKLISLNGLELLMKQYHDKLSIYEFEDCTIDIYVNGDKREELLNKITNSKDSKFGISIDCSKFHKKTLFVILMKFVHC